MIFFYWFFITLGIIIAIELFIRLKVFLLIKNLKEGAAKSLKTISSDIPDEKKQKIILKNSKLIMGFSLKFFFLFFIIIIFFITIMFTSGKIFLDNFIIYKELLNVKFQIIIFIIALLYAGLRITINKNHARVPKKL